MSTYRQPIVVVKIGGSVLADANAYRRAAVFMRDRLRGTSDVRYVVVVSAQDGTTDKLERTAKRIVSSPARRALDLWWATGEMSSVAKLTLHLERLGVSAVGLNVHETGLLVRENDGAANLLVVNSGALEKELSCHRLVVVPGFLGTSPAGTIVSLGRGGSDLTAVLVAISLRAVRCELVKDVAGYFTADPNADASAQHIGCLTYEQALRMADDGCKLVQREALESACGSSLPLIVRSMDKKNLVTAVSAVPFDQGQDVVRTERPRLAASRG